MTSNEKFLKVLIYIMENEPVAINDLSKKFNIHIRTIYRYINVLEKYNFLLIQKESHKSPKVVKINWKHILSLREENL